MGSPMLARVSSRDEPSVPAPDIITGNDSSSAGTLAEKDEMADHELATTSSNVASAKGAGGNPAYQEKAMATASPEMEASTESEDAADSETARRHEMVQELARVYTTRSHADSGAGAGGGRGDGGGVGGNPIIVGSSDPESSLNPNGKNFSAQAWARAVADMVSAEGGAFRTSGVCFQNLDVFGFGAATDYQKTVFNVWLETVGLARRLLGQGKTRIDILRGFDGVVRKGEMLVVLGPPGSGCSTLLKTIAGETDGIFIEGNSYFNYQGMCCGAITDACSFLAARPLASS